MPAAQTVGTVASNAGQPTVSRDIHIHVGTMIADDYGIKELERRLRPIRIAEDQRRGI
jgi:hypothetical protein